MNELRELYQEVILDHNRSPRNFGSMAEGLHAEGYNPLCGDKVDVYVNVESGVLKDVRFTGCGCAISQASASLMTQALKGKTLADAERISGRFYGMVTGSAETVDEEEEIGELEALAGVSEFPMRVKCATLAWHTLESALRGEAAVSTE